MGMKRPETLILLLLFVPSLHAACYDCYLYYCNRTVATVDAKTCSDNVKSDILISLEKPTPECKGKVTAMLCAYFYTNGQNNQNASCINSSKTWCLDYCQELYGCLGSLLEPADCLATTPGNTDCTVVDNSTLDMFRGPPPPIKLERACPDPDAPASDVPILEVELGGLYGRLDCVIKNVTCDESNLTLITKNSSVSNLTLTKVFRGDVPFSSIFPPKCSEYAAYVWTPYLIFCAIWYPVSIIGFILFTIRRKKSPISARSYSLVAIQFLWSQIATYATIDPMMYGLTGSCWFGSAYVSVFSTPAVSLSFILRASRLYYLYRWNQDKLSPEKRGWYVQHREWLLPKRYLLVYAISMFVVGIIFMIYMVTFPYYYVQGTLFDSGRCSWWDINPQIQAFADANGISLKPDGVNPTGYAPYSINYNSCKFCSLSSSREASYSEFGIIWFLVAVVMIVKLRNLNDQYHLWHELFFLLVLYVFAAALSMPFPNDDYASLFLVNAHVHIAIVIGTILNCLAVLVPIFMPLFLSYLWEYQGQKKRKKENSINTSEALRNVKLKQDKYGNAYTNEEINYKLFLQDEHGMEAFRQFCVESFFAEMASFYVRYRQYLDIKDVEEKRAAAKAIYFEFVKENSASELNIPYNFRIKYWEEFEAGRVGTLENGEDMKQPTSGFLWRPIWSALRDPLGKRRSITKPRDSRIPFNPQTAQAKPNLKIKAGALPDEGTLEMPKEDEKDPEQGGDYVEKKDDTSEQKGAAGDAKRLPIDEADMALLATYFVDVHEEICLLISNDWRRFTLSRFYQDFLNALFEQRHFQSVGIDVSKGSAGTSHDENASDPRDNSASIQPPSQASLPSPPSPSYISTPSGTSGAFPFDAAYAGSSASNSNSSIASIGAKSSKGDGGDDPASQSARSISPLLQQEISSHPALDSPSGIRTPSGFGVDENAALDEKDEALSDSHEDDEHPEKSGMDASAREEEIEMMEVY